MVRMIWVSEFFDSEGNAVSKITDVIERINDRFERTDLTSFWMAWKPLYMLSYVYE